MAEKQEARVRFVIPENCKDHSEYPVELKTAFSICEEYERNGMTCEWITTKNAFKLSELTKTDVFVLHNFSGQLFDKLKHLKCLIVGPQCLMQCIKEGVNIPSGPEPIFTIAMRKMSVTASGFSKVQKEDIKKKILRMGGKYESMLTEATTHLVADTVLSDKYFKAGEKGIPILGQTWINACWKESMKNNCDDTSIDLENFKLKIFHGLNITTTNLGKRDKQKIMKCISENGGTFSGAFQSESTNVVVLNKDGVGSEKYKAALEFGKLCVLPEWVYDSVQKGYAQDVTKYRVYGASTSSPLSGIKLPNMSLNFSTIPGRPVEGFIDETATTDTSNISTRVKNSKRSREDNAEIREIQRSIEAFDTNKKALPIFDGYCIYVHGIEGASRDKLNALVSKWGGVRYDRLNDRVSHALCLPDGASASEIPQNIEIMSPLWLLDSIHAGRALPEDNYKIVSQSETTVRAATRSKSKAVEPSSPMSKRSLQMLSQGDKPPVPLFRINEPDEDKQNDETDQIVQQYMQAGFEERNSKHAEQTEKSLKPENSTSSKTEKNNQEDTTNIEEEELEPIFTGLTFEFQGLDEEMVCELASEVEGEGGDVKNEGDGSDYVIVPLDYSADLVRNAAQHAHIVTVFWMRDCQMQREILPVQYYHKPIEIPDAPILEGVVLSISTYTGQERSFLDELAKLLGAVSELRFCRKTTATALASTHLICPLPSGDKFAGAVKWGVPAVSGDWLLQCAIEAKRLPEKEFLVKKDQTTNASTFLENKENLTNVTTRSTRSKVKPAASEEEKVVQEKLDQDVVMPPPHSIQNKRQSIGSHDVTPNRFSGVNLAGDAEMSPASRYIAMARQGLLGSSQDTPKRIVEVKRDANSDAVNTPDTKLSTPDLKAFTPTTRRRLQAVRRGEMPSGPINTPNYPREKNIATPDSGFGGALAVGGKLSPNSRKQLWADIDNMAGRNMTRLQVTKETISQLSVTIDDFEAKSRSNQLLYHGIVEDSSSAKNLVMGFVKTKQGITLEDHDILNCPLSEFCNKIAAGLSQSNLPQPKKLQLDTSEHEKAETPPSKIAKYDDEKNEQTKMDGITSTIDFHLQQISTTLQSRATPRPSLVESRLTFNDRDRKETQASEDAYTNTQTDVVGWDDSSQMKNVATSHLLEEETPPPVKRFMLSSNVENREEIVQMILRLGGEVSESNELDVQASHLLCSNLGRSEKLLGSIAAGKWILHPSYIVRSNQAGTFLGESDFEWGSESASWPNAHGSDDTLATAAKRWRQRKEAKLPAAYQGLKAILHVHPNKRPLFARLIKAGDGQVIEDSPPYSCKNATHCFVEIKRYPLEQKDLEFFVRNRIPVCSAIFLHNFLVEEHTPSAIDHAIPEYRALL